MSIAKEKDEHTEFNEYFEDCFINDFPWFTREKLRTKGYYEWGNVGTDDIMIVLDELDIKILNPIYEKFDISFEQLRIKLECPRFIEKFKYLCDHDFILIKYDGLLFNEFDSSWHSYKGRGHIRDDNLLNAYIVNPNIIDVVDVKKLVHMIIDKDDLEDYYGFGTVDFLKNYSDSCINDIIRKTCYINKNMLEKELEDFVDRQIHKIEKGMTVIKRQYEVVNGIIDILALDRNNIKCIIELKIVGDNKDIIFQSAYYPTQFKEKSRMITICPDYSPKILAALKSLNGVEIMTYYFKGSDRDPQLFLEMVE